MIVLQLLLLLVLPSLLTARTPLTHEAEWLMKRVGAPIPSPDGKLVVFAVTNPAYDEKDQSSDLWGGSVRWQRKAKAIDLQQSPGERRGVERR